MNLKEITELKEKVENAQRQADEARGEIKAAEKQLKDEFDCNSVEEAEKLLKKWQKKLEADEQTLEEEKEAYEEKYKDALNKD
jgi:uncharacterized protein YukE